MEKLNYDNLNDRDSLAIKKIIKESGIDEKEYFKYVSTTNHKYSICKFIYVPDRTYIFEITKLASPEGVFNIKGRPFSDDYKEIKITGLGFYPDKKKPKNPFVLQYFKKWIGFIKNEVATRNELSALGEEPTWAEVQKSASNYNTTHKEILASLGQFIVSFETLMAVTKSMLQMLVKPHTEIGGVLHVELLLSDARAANLKKYLSSAIIRHFEIQEFYREFNKPHYTSIPEDQKKEIISLGKTLNECIGNASTVRNSIVHATWGKSVQGERISMYGVKYGLGKSMNIKKMDYTEIDFNKFSEYFDYITFCIQKLESFFSGKYLNLRFNSGIPYEELFKEENINLVKLNKIKSQLAKFDTGE